MSGEGIQTKTHIPKNASCPDFVKKYAGSEWPPQKWRRVEFLPTTEEEQDKITKAAMNLLDGNISFDTGSGCGSCDWELDWSLRLI